MNIVTPLPTNIIFTTANVNTEAARRDNVMRETVPQTAGTENSASESGLGSESDRVKQPGTNQQPVTYERPQNQQQQNAERADDQANKDNAEDPSAGKEEAESRQQQQQEQAEQREIRDLKARDLEVRNHEQAHASVGGQYAGAPKYEYENGPDGKQYAVGGEVSIDISEESSPEETLRKMQQVKAAALAPAEPSPQDLRVANEATQKAQEARAEMAEQRTEEAQKAYNSAFENAEGQSGTATTPSQNVPDLDEIVDGRDIGPPTRSLEESDPVAEAVGLEVDDSEYKAAAAMRERLASRDEQTLQRVAVIEGFYGSVSAPKEDGLALQA
ncbi:putative metalloprotease CJM1_0395 family protein [Aestuariibacter sp. AA17]|uniref:Metalloprotease CJM1_0395 family protein n=1 Tax=Fluctibacter corallii TaxID=2984329 RepID=A0ABT3AC16_9ALTE|nr:putative metalloprotease CJM1_0395 family protein [Aestuariibacter sp. AA17]MCV2885826.1 putative metalloprotease CJM1_0395 family protein [Aestuariibacter sp. AA17]